MRLLKVHPESGFKHGFSDATINVCGITADNYKDFLSDLDYMKNHPYNGAYTSIIDNKLYLPLLLKNYKENVPGYFYYIDERGLLPLEDNQFGNQNTRVSIDVFFNTLAQEKILCLKHTHSSVGEGFMLVKQEKDVFYLNNEEISKENLAHLVLSLRQYIVTEYIQQHKYASDICSTSLNTVRFLLVWDDEEQSFCVPRSFHRFGCDGNIVDNLGSGSGVLVFVDVNTGKITSEGKYNYKSKGDVFKENIIHPDHNICLTGIQIPNFDKIKGKLIKIFNEISYLRCAGVDVAVTEGGFKIIEINSLPGLSGIQQGIGLLSDSRIKKVLKK